MMQPAQRDGRTMLKLNSVNMALMNMAFMNMFPGIRIYIEFDMYLVCDKL